MGQRATHRMSSRLIDRLNELAASFQPLGVRLFIFGSVAQTFPESYRGADLDLGYELDLPDAKAVLVERDLRCAIENLPTIRPIDLVNLGKVGREFAANVRLNRIPLPVDHE